MTKPPATSLIRREILPALLLAAAGHGTALARPMTPMVPPPGSSERAEAVDVALAAGRLALGAGQLVPALQHYTQALALDPDSVVALNGIAVCYDRLGRFDVSRTYYEIALGIDPSSAAILNNYGYSLYLQGETRQALRFLSLAVTTGDAEVQQRALLTLAAMDSRQQPAQPARARLARAADSSESARIVRTSAHELRLVLDDAGSRSGTTPAAGSFATRSLGLPAVFRDLDPEIIAAILPVAALDVVAEGNIACTPTPTAIPEPEPVPAWIQAIADFARFAPTAEAPEWPQRLRLLLPADAPTGPHDPRWDAHQIIDFPAPGTGIHHDCRLPTRTIADSTGASRVFDLPFDSDDARLNRFAERMQARGPDRSKQLTRLISLLDRAGGVQQS